MAAICWSIVSTDFPNFGEVAVGDFVEHTFRITNTGDGTLAGTVAMITGTNFSIQGTAAYSLGAGQSQDFTIRFAPISIGTKSDIIDAGNDLCYDRNVIGKGISGAICKILTPYDYAKPVDALLASGSPAASLNFGSVAVGSYVEMKFKIKNTGEVGNLAGTVSVGGSDFSIQGTAAYNLAPQASQEFTVRFAPSSYGLKTDFIETGNTLCDDIPIMGTGKMAPSYIQINCGVDPLLLDFGDVGIGDQKDLQFQITNMADTGTLAGTVSVSGSGFSIVGTAAYSLASGVSQTFTVRFAPTTFGEKSVFVETGNNLCKDIRATGKGKMVALPIEFCRIEPKELNFGNVGINNSSDLKFQITNIGMVNHLEGTASIIGSEFSLPDTTYYFLAPGGKASIIVRFTPTSFGVKTAFVNLGNTTCHDVALTGRGAMEAIPLPEFCNVDPLEIDFGIIPFGSYAEAPFKITNTGRIATLAGTVAVTSDDFSIQGTATYSLTPGQSQTFTLRFKPTTFGPKSVFIDTGNMVCKDILAKGSARMRAVPLDFCEVIVGDKGMDFGVVQVGSYADIKFEIKNVGVVASPETANLVGAVSIDGPDFDIQGTSEYDLAPGESSVFTLRFAPQRPGLKSKIVDLGNSLCKNLSATGVGFGPVAIPITTCEVITAGLDFGDVLIGESLEKTIRIKNTGTDGNLTGTVSVVGPDFTIQGSATYDLAPGGSKWFTIRFAPLSTGYKEKTIETGNALCSDLTVTGTGTSAPICTLDVTSLDFGNVAVDEYSEKQFTITNDGQESLAGTVSANGTGFSIQGTAAYNLGAGEYQNFTVRFTPGSLGVKTGIIETGNVLCSDIYVTGTGGSTCTLDPTSLNFGTVGTETIKDMILRITNYGTAVLSGTVSIATGGSQFSIIGDATYSLATGEYQDFTIRFTSDEPGVFPGSVETGNALCSDITLTATAIYIATTPFFDYESTTVYLRKTPIPPYPVSPEIPATISRTEDLKIKVYEHGLAGDKKRTIVLTAYMKIVDDVGYRWLDLESFYHETIHGARERFTFSDGVHVYTVRMTDFGSPQQETSNIMKIRMVLEEDYA